MAFRRSIGVFIIAMTIFFARSATSTRTFTPSIISADLTFVTGYFVVQALKAICCIRLGRDQCLVNWIQIYDANGHCTSSKKYVDLCLMCVIWQTYQEKIQNKNNIRLRNSLKPTNNQKNKKTQKKKSEALCSCFIHLFAQLYSFSRINVDVGGSNVPMASSFGRSDWKMANRCCLVIRMWCGEYNPVVGTVDRATDDGSWQYGNFNVTKIINNNKHQ